mgnify:CR=1 FL=1|jgi:NACalpha-BTF3-like transcription factor
MGVGAPSSAPVFSLNLFPPPHTTTLTLSLSHSTTTREAALAAIKLAEADVGVVMDAADLARPAAERALREAGGKLEAALGALARPGKA